MDAEQLTEQGRQLRRERQFQRMLPTIIALWVFFAFLVSMVILLKVGIVQAVLTFLGMNVWLSFFFMRDSRK